MGQILYTWETILIVRHGKIVNFQHIVFEQAMPWYLEWSRLFESIVDAANIREFRKVQFAEMIKNYESLISNKGD